MLHIEIKLRRSVETKLALITKKMPNCLMDGVGAQRRVLLIFYFEFEYRKHLTIKRDAKKCSGDARVFS